MAARLSTHQQKVYDYLVSISPSGATNAEIVEATRIQPHQTVFQITKLLMKAGLTRGEQGRYREKEWVFFARLEKTAAEKGEPVSRISAVSQSTPLPKEFNETATSPADFERLTTRVMSDYFGVSLGHGKLPGVSKDFDLVSADGNIVGDAKYLTLVGGERLPPAKFSMIAEHVWLLENTHAKRKFLVFGNQREAPAKWLERFGHLVRGVEFYFLSDDGGLERLNG
jgi:hypothetical protein